MIAASAPGASLTRSIRQAGRVSDSEVSAGRIQRLRHELRDEQIWVPEDPDLADLLFAELDYARHPHAHEGTAPRYGALIATGQRPTSIVEPVSFIESAPSPWAFFVAWPTGGRRSSCAPSVPAIAWRASSAPASSSPPRCTWRSPPARSWCSGSVRAGCDSPRSRESPRGTGSGGPRSRSASASPSASPPTLPGAEPALLANLVEFSTHWLGAGRVGAAIVWRLDGDARELGGLGFASAVEIPPLDLTDRTHFAPLLNALSQYDRAALVDANGCVVVGRGAPSELGTVAPRASGRSAGPVTRRRCGSPPTCRTPSCSSCPRAAR